jgi:methylmalonyl-CoA mutase cobalamin-binding subunit
VLAASVEGGEGRARAVAESLGELGVEAMYLGREESVRRIAAFVAQQQADAVELCLARSGGGVLLLRGLLRELTEMGRRDVSIVVHGIE